MRVETRVEPINQAAVVTVRVPMLGRNLTMRTDWSTARRAAYRWRLDGLEPGSAHHIDVAERRFEVTAGDDGVLVFEWDGLDAEGRRVGPDLARLDGGGTRIRLGRWDPRDMGLGGFMISGYDHLDAVARRVHTANGRLKGNLVVTATDSGHDVRRDSGRRTIRFDPDGYMTELVDNSTGAVVETYERDAEGLVGINDAGVGISTIRNDRGVTLVRSGWELALDVDGDGRVTALIDPAGNTTSLSYAENGALAAVVDPSGFRHEFDHDGDGRLTGVTEPGAGRIDLVRTQTEHGIRVSSITAEGRESYEQTERLPDGDLVRTSKCCGTHPAVTRIVRGSIESDRPDGTRIVNDRSTGTRQVILPSGLTHTRVVHGDTIAVNGNEFVRGVTEVGAVSRTPTGREYSLDITDSGFAIGRPDGTRTEVGKDAKGRVVRLVDGPQIMEFEYDEMDLLAAVRWPDGSTARFEHDGAGWLTAQHSPDGRSVRIDSDGSGLVRRLQTPGGDMVEFSYRSPTDLTFIKFGSADDRIDFEYDKDGLVVSRRVTGGATVTYTRDVGGQIESIQAGGELTRVTNEHGRPVEITGPDGQQTRLTYDGALTTRIDLSGPVAGSVEYEYDEGFRRSAIRCGALRAGLAYDADGQLVRAGEAEIERDAAGRVARIVAGVVTTEHTFDKHGSLASISVSVNGETVWSAQYNHDVLRRVDRISDSAWSDPIALTYDEAGRLIEASQQFSARYNGHGNLISLVRNGQTMDAVVAPVDRLASLGEISVSYEAGAVAAFGHQKVTRNGLGRLVTVGDGTASTLIRRDGVGRITGINTGDRELGLIPGPHGRPEAVLDSGGSPVALLVGVDASESPLLAVQGDRTLFLATDHVGSVRRVIDIETGEVVDARDYDVWGELVHRQGDSPVPYGFAGGIDDPDQRMVHFPARSYSTALLRWLSRDPALFEGGSSNLYVYCNNDPVNFRDPTGATVEVCRRKTDLAIAPEVIFQDKEHWWLRTKTEEAGMGSGAGTKVGVLDHSGQGDQRGSECDPVEDVDEECVNSHIEMTRQTPGGYEYGDTLGYYGPGNTCQNFVDDVLSACSGGDYEIQTNNPDAYEHWYNPDTNIGNYSTEDRPLDYTPDPGQSTLDGGALWE